MAAERGTSSDWTFPGEEQELPSPTAGRWQRLERKLRRLRFHQRLWGLLGGYLQTFSSQIREQVKRLQ